MQRLWTPWRSSYVRRREPLPECLFCWMAAATAEQSRERLVVYRGKLNLVAVNKFPYSSGHVMIAPFAHVADLVGAEREQLEELILLAQASERILRREYRAQGINVGMNLGVAAGAGVPGHHHLHVVPRWEGDTNFLGAASETRVIPEMPDRTWERLQPAFASLDLSQGATGDLEPSQE